MDFLIDKVVGILDKFKMKIKPPSIPWEKYNQAMDFLGGYLADANVIFPVDDLMVMVGIVVAIRAVLFVVWGISFVRKMLPF